MDIKNFIYLIEVADTGSITKAAQKLYMSQPYLSKIIREVEENFKINIFIRTSQGVVLTPEGEKFIKQTKLMLREYNKFADISNQSNRSRKTFSVTTVRSSLVVESFIRLTKEYQDYNIEFSIKESGGIEPLQDIYLLNADLGVIYTQCSKKSYLLENLKRRGILYKKISKLSSCIILRSGHPLLEKNEEITFNSLKQYGLVRYDNDVLTYEADSKKIYDSLIQTNDIKNIINISDRALFHNVLTQTNFFSIGTTAAKNQEELFGIVSIPFTSFNFGEEIEMGIIRLQNSNLNPVSNRFIEILLQTYS